MSEPMEAGSRVYVAGHSGLAGSALTRCLRERGYDGLITRSHSELDLTDQRAVQDFFSREKPEYVLLAAAKVGGIFANSRYAAEFIRDNIAIQTNVIHEAWRAGVKRLLFLGSSCVYPRDCPQPIREEYLLTGPLEWTNRSYALAKISGIEMCWSYNRQYGASFLAVMPSNLYGPGDNHDHENSHVIPALIRKFHEAKTRNLSTVNVWGTGNPRREFLHSDDLAKACVLLLEMSERQFAALPGQGGENCDSASERAAASRAERLPPIVNVGPGEDLSIGELARLVKEVVGFSGRIAFDTSKPDGTPRKLLDVSLLRGLGWQSTIGLPEGLRGAYSDYLAACNR